MLSLFISMLLGYRQDLSAPEYGYNNRGPRRARSLLKFLCSDNFQDNYFLYTVGKDVGGKKGKKCKELDLRKDDYVLVFFSYNCPDAKKLMRMLSPLADQGKISVRYVDRANGSMYFGTRVNDDDGTYDYVPCSSVKVYPDYDETTYDTYSRERLGSYGDSDDAKYRCIDYIAGNSTFSPKIFAKREGKWYGPFLYHHIGKSDALGVERISYTEGGRKRFCGMGGYII